MITQYHKDLQSAAIPNLDILNGCNILVTGSTGLIGSCVIELLMLYNNDYNYKVFAGCRDLERAQKRFQEFNDINYIEIDVTKPLDTDIRFDYIIDAASHGSPNFFATDPVGIMKANLNGVCNLLDYGINHELKRFLYISSGEIYGDGCNDKWTEDCSGYVNSMKMRSCYPSSKRAAETLCVAYSCQYKIDVVVARLCHTYGPFFTSSDNRVYAQFIRNVLNGDNIILKSKGEQFRSWLYVVDCAAALLYILIKGKSKEAYNVANNESNISIRHLADIIANITNKKVLFDLSTVVEDFNSIPIKKAVFDTLKIEELGWHAKFGIYEGLKNTILSKL